MMKRISDDDMSKKIIDDEPRNYRNTQRWYLFKHWFNYKRTLFVSILMVYDIVIIETLYYE